MTIDEEKIREKFVDTVDATVRDLEKCMDKIGSSNEIDKESSAFCVDRVIEKLGKIQAYFNMLDSFEWHAERRASARTKVDFDVSSGNLSVDLSILGEHLGATKVSNQISPKVNDLISAIDKVVAKDIPSAHNLGESIAKVRSIENTIDGQRRMYDYLVEKAKDGLEKFKGYFEAYKEEKGL